MSDYPKDIYTEPRNIDVDTLANLGPLRGLAGVWQGLRGADIKPKANGPKQQDFLEEIELQPLDPQTNGPQLLYGLRYHQHATKPESFGTYHDQVGYWLWEPATETVIHTLTIPRGMVVMAVGRAKADATEFELVAKLDDAHYGIRSIPFLEHAFNTVEFRIKISIDPRSGWSYDEDTVLQIRGQKELFHHRDRNTLTLIDPPTPNPLARG